MRPLLLLLLIPFCVSPAQQRTISPFARVGTGFGTFGFSEAGYDDAKTITLEVGALLNPHFGVSAEHMRLAGFSDSGRWTVGTVRLYPVKSDHVVAPWLAGGAGWATADTPDHEGSPSVRQHVRFSGPGLHSAIGLDMRMARHIFIVPTLAVRRTVGAAEEQRCLVDSNVPAYSYGAVTCYPWTSLHHKFQTFELTISGSVRR